MLFFCIFKMVKTKTKISKQIQKKTNKELVQTIILAKKNKNWIEVASILSMPRKKRININLEELNKIKEEKVVIPGKVLSQGELKNKKEIIAINFSEKTKEKLDNLKISYSYILDEIKKNPEAKGVKILK